MTRRRVVWFIPMVVGGLALVARDGDVLTGSVKQRVAYLADGGKSLSLNLGTGKGTSIKELIDTIQRLTGFDVPKVFAPAREGDPPSLYADPSKAREILGWAAERDLDEILVSAWKWQQKLDGANRPA